VSPLGCSRPLQRAIVDFAADQPFVQKHYGFAIGEHDPADHVRPR
jgi:hypothetical protein